MYEVFSGQFCIFGVNFTMNIGPTCDIYLTTLNQGLVYPALYLLTGPDPIASSAVSLLLARHHIIGTSRVSAPVCTVADSISVQKSATVSGPTEPPRCGEVSSANSMTPPSSVCVQRCGSSTLLLAISSQYISAWPVSVCHSVTSASDDVHFSGL